MSKKIRMDGRDAELMCSSANKKDINNIIECIKNNFTSKDYKEHLASDGNTTEVISYLKRNNNKTHNKQLDECLKQIFQNR